MNNRTRRRRAVLLTLCLLAGLVAVPIVRTWRQVRQERMNHALIAAVDRNDTVTVRTLLKQGADPNAPVLPEDTRSLWNRLLDVLRPPSSLHPATHATTHETVLLKAVHWCSVVPVGRPGSGPFIDNAETVQALIDAGANVNRPGDDPGGVYAYVGIHPLSVSKTGAPPLPAAGGQTTPLIAAENLGKWRTVKALLARTDDVNMPNSTGEMPLAVAAIAARADVVEALIRAGANINARPIQRATALENACAADGYPVSRVRATVACLLRHGAVVGMNELMWVHEINHDDPQLIQMLKRAGARN